MDQVKPKTLNEYLASISQEVSDDFRRLRLSALKAGPLSHEILEIVLLVSFATAGMEGAFKGHARRALAGALTKDQVQHALIAVLGATLPMASVAESLKWIDEL